MTEVCLCADCETTINYQAVAQHEGGGIRNVCCRVPYNASGIRFFTEDRANLRYGKHGASHQRYLKVQMALASFHAELFGN